MRRTLEHDRVAAGFGEGECRGGRLERRRELRASVLGIGLGARRQSDDGANADDLDVAQIRRPAAVDQRGIDQEGAFPREALKSVRAEVQGPERPMESPSRRVAYVSVQAACAIATRGSAGRTLSVPFAPGAPV